MQVRSERKKFLMDQERASANIRPSMKSHVRATQQMEIHICVKLTIFLTVEQISFIQRAA